MKNEPTTTWFELRRRLLFTLFRPAATLARRMRVPLDEYESLARLAYVEELRTRGGYTQAEAARVLGKSLRTVTSAQAQLQSDFLAPATEREQHRRAEDLLGSGPRTVEELRAEFGWELEEVIERLLESLVEAGRATKERDANGKWVYGPAQRFHSLVSSELPSRLDGLRHQLDVLTAAVVSRFIIKEDREHTALARTLGFWSRPEDAATLSSALIQQIRELAVQAEERALAEGGGERYGVTLAIAPAQD